MEEAMHFLDEVKNKYLHQVEQAMCVELLALRLERAGRD
jgi:hypothetical protein